MNTLMFLSAPRSTYSNQIAINKATTISYI